jgi:hypothetical protein
VPITKSGVVEVVIGQSYGYQAITNGQFQLVFYLSEATTMGVTVYAPCEVPKDPIEITLQPGETRYLEVEVKPCGVTGALFGAITDISTGSPVTGAQVQASRMKATTTTTTGWNGNYLLPLLEAGSYTVTVSMADYTGSTSLATVLAGETTRTDLSLTSSTGGDSAGGCAGTSSKASGMAGNALLLIAFPSIIGVLALLKAVWPNGC